MEIECFVLERTGIAFILKYNLYPKYANENPANSDITMANIVSTLF